MFEGSFDSDKAAAFIAPLSDILRVGISSPMFSISETGLRISTSTATGSNYVVVKYKDAIFEDFTFPAQPFNFGIVDLSELTGIMRVFKNGFNIKVTDVLTTLSHKSNKFIYYSNVEKKCQKGPKSLKTKEEPKATLKWGEDMEEFMRAASQLSNNEHIVIEGNKGESDIDLAVTNTNFVRFNTFKVEVESSEIDETFKHVISKEIFQPIVAGSVSEFDVHVYDRSIVFHGETDYYEISHAVTPKNK
jgi:hypothetical protein